ncbi:MAG: hypothetical protein GXX85_17760 [Ignavibacteria bacterium]|nr:hypothetical protein [Ignavibacteria bacterium]
MKNELLKRIEELEQRVNAKQIHIIFDDYNDPKKAVEEYEAKHKIKIPPESNPIIISFV